LVITIEMNKNLNFTNLDNLRTIIMYTNNTFNLSADSFNHYEDYEVKNEGIKRFYTLKPKVGSYLIKITNKEKNKTMEFKLYRST